MEEKAQVWLQANAPEIASPGSGLSMIFANLSWRNITSMLGGSILALVLISFILIAALREGMLGLAGREGDGAILNWLSAEDVKQVAPIVHAGGEGKEIAARIFVLPVEDRGTALAIGRRAVAAYLKHRKRFAGRRVAIVICGGNLAVATLREILNT